MLSTLTITRCPSDHRAQAHLVFVRRISALTAQARRHLTFTSTFLSTATKTSTTTSRLVSYTFAALCCVSTVPTACFLCRSFRRRHAVAIAVELMYKIFMTGKRMMPGKHVFAGFLFSARMQTN